MRQKRVSFIHKFDIEEMEEELFIFKVTSYLNEKRNDNKELGAKNNVVFK